MLSPCPTRSILSSSLSLVRSPTVEVVALSFFIYIFVSTYFVLCTSGALRLVSFVVITFFFFFRLSQKRRHSVLAVLPAIILCFRANSPKRLAKIEHCLVLHHDRFAHLFVRYFHLDVTLSFFSFYLSLFVLACICIFVRLVPRRLNVSPCSCAL